MERKQMTFDEIACCAMTHAFLRNPVQVREWARAIGPMQILYEFFQRTVKLSFIPNEETVLVYRSFVVSELQRLAGAADSRLLCAHERETHVSSLMQLLSQFPTDFVS